MSKLLWKLIMALYYIFTSTYKAITTLIKALCTLSLGVIVAVMAVCLIGGTLESVHWVAKHFSHNAKQTLMFFMWGMVALVIIFVLYGIGLEVLLWIKYKVNRYKQSKIPSKRVEAKWY